MTPMGLRRGFAALAVGALLLAAVFLGAGCGSDDSDTTGAEGTVATTTDGGGAQGGDGGGGEGGGDASKQASGPGGNDKAGGGGGAQDIDREPTEKEVEEFRAPEGGDDSIQTYGEVAEEEEEEEIVSTMRAFFRALADLDYAAVCDGITAANRQAFQRFLKVQEKEGSCETVLEGLLQKAAAPEARRAANGVVYQVRVEDDNAFVLFTPEGGKASYFVMMQEDDGSWKATGISAGTPFDPLS
jgi:hypothetical protein